MTIRWAAGMAGLALVVALLACSTSGSGSPSVSDRATSLAQTAAALLTGTAAASITPETPTPLPTDTPAATPLATASRVPATNTPTRPAPLPSATQTPCANDKAEFVSDVNVPDGTHFAAGAAFQKTWRLRNNGDCAWTTDYTLRNVGGEVMGGATINMPNTVPPGVTVDLTVSLVAPDSPGKHTGRWQMFTPAGVAFGTKPFVQVTVP
jgi:hypothetical protein